MASTARLAFSHLVHGDFGRAEFHFEQLRVARIATIANPVHPVWKDGGGEGVNAHAPLARDHDVPRCGYCLRNAYGEEKGERKNDPLGRSNWVSDLRMHSD